MNIFKEPATPKKPVDILSSDTHIVACQIGYQNKAEADEAALSGNIHKLDQLADIHIIPSPYVANAIASKSHTWRLTVLEWLADHSILPDNSAINTAIINNDSDMLMWLMQKQVVVTRDIINYALVNSDYNVINVLKFGKFITPDQFNDFKRRYQQPSPVHIMSQRLGNVETAITNMPQLPQRIISTPHPKHSIPVQPIALQSSVTIPPLPLRPMPKQHNNAYQTGVATPRCGASNTGYPLIIKPDNPNKVFNPKTRRWILKNGDVYNKLVSEGVIQRQ